MNQCRTNCQCAMGKASSLESVLKSARVPLLLLLCVYLTWYLLPQQTSCNLRITGGCQMNGCRDNCQCAMGKASSLETVLKSSYVPLLCVYLMCYFLNKLLAFYAS